MINVENRTDSCINRSICSTFNNGKRQKDMRQRFGRIAPRAFVLVVVVEIKFNKYDGMIRHKRHKRRIRPESNLIYSVHLQPGH